MHYLNIIFVSTHILVLYFVTPVLAAIEKTTPVVHHYSLKVPQSGLKNIRILATGGTIAGAAPSSTQTVGYKASALPVQVLLDAVPAIHDIANVSAEQFRQMASENMDSSTWLALAKHINMLLADDKIDGIVITHGTDTLEETAYFLQLTVKSHKPVILVGAIRPATALSADGPLNLYNAVIVAANPDSYGKGVLVVMDDIILSSRDAQKCSTYRTCSFKGVEYGTIGTVEGGHVTYAYAPLKKHTLQSIFDISNINKLPIVPILYAYAGSDTTFLETALNNGAQGVVIACTGNGSFNTTLRNFLSKKSLDTIQSLPILRSSRISGGAVAYNGEVNDDVMHTIPAGDLNPQKARILLMLGLAHGMNKTQIKEIFQQY